MFSILKFYCNWVNLELKFKMFFIIKLQFKYIIFNIIFNLISKEMGRNWNSMEDDMLRELIAQYGK